MAWRCSSSFGRMPSASARRRSFGFPLLKRRRRAGSPCSVRNRRRVRWPRREAIVDAMRGGLLQFAFCHRFHAPLNAAQDLIRSGKLGALVQIENRFAFRFARAGKSWFTEADIAGGGILIDTLVHSIDIFRALTGQEIDSACGRSSRPHCRLRWKTAPRCWCGAAGGVLGTLNCSWVTPIAESFVRIHGSEGQAVIDYNAAAGLRYKLAEDADWTELQIGLRPIASRGRRRTSSIASKASAARWSAARMGWR